MFSKLERKTVRHMMESVGLIALGYIIAVAGAESTAVIIAGRLVLPDSLRTRNAPSESKTSCSDQTSRRTKSYGRRCGLIRIFPFKLE